MNESYQHPSKWTDVSPPFENREPNTHLMSYNIQHLDPSSVYEALVQAKNRYGWNEVSEMFQFYTRAAGEDSYGIQLSFHHLILSYSLLYFHGVSRQSHAVSKNPRLQGVYKSGISESPEIVLVF